MLVGRARFELAVSWSQTRRFSELSYRPPFVEGPDSIEPALPIDRIEPALPMLRIEPALPMLRIEPALPMLKIEPALPMLKIEKALNRLAKLRTL